MRDRACIPVVIVPKSYRSGDILNEAAIFPDLGEDPEISEKSISSASSTVVTLHPEARTEKTARHSGIQSVFQTE